MPTDVLDDKITAYQRSPNEELYHYGVGGMNWYKHKFGNWERHAKYANGQPNPETAGSKGPYSSPLSRDARRARKQKKKEELWLKMLGKEGERPREDWSNLSSDELKEKTARLKIENDYLTALKNAKTLDEDFYKLTSSKGLLKKMEENAYDVAGKVTKKTASLALLKALEAAIGEEDAAYLLGDFGRKGKKGGDKKKEKEEDAYKKRTKELNDDLRRYKAEQDWDKTHPGKREEMAGNREISKQEEEQARKDSREAFGKRKKEEKRQKDNEYSSDVDRSDYNDYDFGDYYDNYDYYNSKYFGPKTVNSITRRKQPTRKSKKR